MVQDYDKGGLRAPSIEIMAKSLNWHGYLGSYKVYLRMTTNHGRSFPITFSVNTVA